MAQQTNLRQRDPITRALWIATALVAFAGIIVHNHANSGYTPMPEEEHLKYKRNMNEALTHRINETRTELKLSSKQIETIRLASGMLASHYEVSDSRLPEYAEDLNEFSRLNTERDLLLNIKYDKDSEFTKAVASVNNVIDADIDPVELAKELAFAKRLDMKDQIEQADKAQCARTPDSCTPSP